MVLSEEMDRAVLEKNRSEITEGGSKRGIPACYRSRWPGLAKPSLRADLF